MHVVLARGNKGLKGPQGVVQVKAGPEPTPSTRSGMWIRPSQARLGPRWGCRARGLPLTDDAHIFFPLATPW
jgi:hypothetical protein